MIAIFMIQSELRVRHRDETKTVSRLTMENMNLASRCREAITHVAMLKKELLVQQRRVEELEGQQQLPATAAVSAVPMAQQQQQQMTTPMQKRAPPQTPPMSADMKQTLAASPPPPPPAGPPPPSANKRVSPNAALDRQSSQRQQKRGSDGSGGDGSGNGGGAAAPFVSGGANRVLAAKAQQQQQMPASVDDDFSDEDDVDNFLDDTPDDELDVDDVTDKLSKEAFFGEEPGRPAQHLPATPEKGDAVVGTGSPMGQVNSQPPKRKIQKGVDPDIGRPPSPVFSNGAMVKARTEMSTMSSIDAFEASFDTTFPTSFQSAVQKDGPAPSLDISFDVPDFSDPFYLGSDGDRGNISFPDSHGPSPSSSGGMSMTSGGGPSATKGNSFGGGISGAKQPRSSPASASGQVGKTPASPTPANSSFSPDLFPSSPMSELKKEPDFVGDEDVDRPSAPEFPIATPAVNGHSASPHAPGPEKSGVGAAAARARYDAALGHEEPKSNGSVPKSPGNAASIASKRELSNSASQVLKRIQQRRAKTGGGESPVNAAAPPPESSPAQNGNAPTSQFSPYGAGASTPASNAADAKLAAIRNSARRAPAGGTVDGDYGPKRRAAKPYSGGGDNLAMFKATNPSPSNSNSKYRSANSRTASHRLSPTSMNAELDNLDAIAAQAGTVPSSAGTDAPAADGTRRSGRAVKQPVSYAEPSLNSKIRKGHQYFPKQNDAAAANGTGFVAPAASPAQPR